MYGAAATDRDRYLNAHARRDRLLPIRDEHPGPQQTAPEREEYK